MSGEACATSIEDGAFFSRFKNLSGRPLITHCERSDTFAVGCLFETSTHIHHPFESFRWPIFSVFFRFSLYPT